MSSYYIHKIHPLPISWKEAGFVDRYVLGPESSSMYLCLGISMITAINRLRVWPRYYLSVKQLMLEVLQKTISYTRSAVLAEGAAYVHNILNTDYSVSQFLHDTLENPDMFLLYNIDLGVRALLAYCISDPEGTKLMNEGPNKYYLNMFCHYLKCNILLHSSTGKQRYGRNDGFLILLFDTNPNFAIMRHEHMVHIDKYMKIPPSLTDFPFFLNDLPSSQGEVPESIENLAQRLARAVLHPEDDRSDIPHHVKSVTEEFQFTNNQYLEQLTEIFNEPYEEPFPDPQYHLHRIHTGRYSIENDSTQDIESKLSTPSQVESPHKPCDVPINRPDTCESPGSDPSAQEVCENCLQSLEMSNFYIKCHGHFICLSCRMKLAVFKKNRCPSKKCNRKYTTLEERELRFFKTL